MVIVKNKIRCNHCNDEISSDYTHDFKFCSCGRVSVDGGHSYLKRSFNHPSDITELSVLTGRVKITKAFDNFKKGDIDTVIIDYAKDQVYIKDNVYSLNEWEKLNENYKGEKE